MLIINCLLVWIIGTLGMLKNTGEKGTNEFTLGDQENEMIDRTNMLSASSSNDNDSNHEVYLDYLKKKKRNDL